MRTRAVVHAFLVVGMQLHHAMSHRTDGTDVHVLDDTGPMHSRGAEATDFTAAEAMFSSLRGKQQPETSPSEASEGSPRGQGSLGVLFDNPYDSVVHNAEDGFEKTQAVSVNKMNNLEEQTKLLLAAVKKAAAKKKEEKAAAAIKNTVVASIPGIQYDADMQGQAKSIHPAVQSQSPRAMAMDRSVVGHLGEGQRQGPLSDPDIVAANQAAQNPPFPSGVSVQSDNSVAKTQNLVNEINQLALEAARDRVQANQQINRVDSTNVDARSLRAQLDDYIQPVEVQSPMCCRWGNCTNGTDCRNWWNAHIPDGEAEARQEANERMLTLMKLIAESRVREAKADNETKTNLEGIISTEEERTASLLKETTMNSSENGWWDLPRYQPEPQKDHNVSIGYPAPAPPQDWMDIYGPNATSTYNETTGQMRIAYDEEGYPKPWSNINNTNASGSGSESYELGQAQSPSHTVYDTDSTALQNQVNTEMNDLDFASDRQLRESKEDNGRKSHESSSLFDLQQLTPTHVEVPAALMDDEDLSTKTTDMFGNVRIGLSPTELDVHDTTMLS